jgi:4-alpha-glucanotransferase
MANIRHKKHALKKMAGVLAPLFSIYSENSLGIGDFEDIKLLVDWCKGCGISIIQLLPMNETGPTSCPYDSISSFALEPMYASIKRQRASVRRQAKERKSHVDYWIKEEKRKMLWDIVVSEKNTASNSEFQKFCEENVYWLDDFSLYKALKDYHGGAPWYEWKEGYKNRDQHMLEEFANEHEKEISFQKGAQWILFKQFKAAKDYANSKGVSIKGDLPILVSRDSADVWAHPDFFKLEYAAGAPPDMYCAKGQRWGMPTYRWEDIESDDFAYIKEKLKFAENFYDILRIDHIVGLFRIWSIPYNEPMDNKGLNGFFDPNDENRWGEQGKKLLSILQKNTDMILCGEDLGVIPNVCRETLKEMRIPGNDVQRWVKDWAVAHDFLEPENYRKLSVAMLSTHDTTNWSGWWENEAGTVDEDLFIRKCSERGIDYISIKDRLFDPLRSRHGRLRWREKVNSVRIFADILGKREEEVRDFIEMYENTYREKEKLWKHFKIKGPMREKSDPEIVKEALKITASSAAVYCIELIFDLLGLSDICKGDPYKYRVNTPGTVSPDNWSLTVPISLEKLLKHKVNKEIKAIISASGRG